MKKILTNKLFWTVVSCIIFFFLLSFISTTLGLTYWQPDHPHCRNLYVLQNYVDGPDVLVMGSSTTQMGIHPSVIEEEFYKMTGNRISAFNAAQFGGNVLVDKAILKEVLRWKKRRPKLIVLGLDIHRVNTGGLHHSAPFFFPFYPNQIELLLSAPEAVASGNFDLVVRGFLRDTSNLLWLVTAHPLLPENRESLAEIYRRKGAIETDESSSPGRSEIHRRWNRVLKDYEIDGRIDGAFREFVMLCEEESIKVVVVNMPVYARLLESEISMDAYPMYIEFVSAACEREHVRFVNLQEEISGLDYAEFGNLNHLNNRGAKIVSEFVAHEIVLPELIDR